jgi:5'-3' exonuclease
MIAFVLANFFYWNLGGLMDTLLIVDGSNLLFQMFYGMPARIPGVNGKPIHGTLGFVGALLKMIRMTGPTHVAVLFDGETANPRANIDDAYKANRPDYSVLTEEEIPFSQLPDIYAALDFLKIAHRETTDCEADDWIASYALRCTKETRVIIASFDSDFFQLIRDNVQILRYRGKNTLVCDRTYLREKLSIAPEQYAAYKSLTGDAADNIQGVPHVGPKTAAALINRFGDLENLLANIDAITKPSIRSAVSEHADRIRTNYRLIRLENCTPLPFSAEQLTYTDTGFSTRQVLTGIGLL